MIECREYSYASDAYRKALNLRMEVLKRPLGIEFDMEELAREGSEYHLGAFEAGVLLATMILTPLGEEAKMRQVAVHPSRQGSGIGTTLVGFSETFCRERGFRKMILNARESAVPFYERLGYVRVGEPFEEVTILHYAMKKPLLPG
ncbi:MAG TPA: GNAT family N-acetyltransferase [Fimbriimonadaceae bacterium]|nr:GNAT family N-acetyltransferase [Fimbriimonadaceae bacterium]